MNFTQQIKKEILDKKRNIEETREFLKGFIYAKGKINNSRITLRIYNELTKTTVLQMIKKININFKNKKSVIIIDNDDLDLKVNFEHPSAFFQGVFAGGGTISNLNQSSYHLQLSSNYEEFINVIMNKLNEYDFNFVKIKHNNKYIIYIKKYEKISDFLKAVVAVNSLFRFLDNAISRDLYNNINRLNNIDFHNIKKTVNANAKHLKNINYIKENSLENNFNINQLRAFEILEKNTHESLRIIVEKYNQKYEKQISKSSLHHWLKKLEKIVKDHKKTH